MGDGDGKSGGSSWSGALNALIQCGNLQDVEAPDPVPPPADVEGSPPPVPRDGAGGGAGEAPVPFAPAAPGDGQDGLVCQWPAGT